MATVPPDVVGALMTMTPESNVGGLRIARFTDEARADILAKFPGATYTKKGDFEKFVYEKYEASVMIDDDTLMNQGIDWDTATDDQLKQGVIVEVTKVDHHRRQHEKQKDFVAALEALAKSLPQAHSAPAAGGRKTRRGKKRSRRVRR